jgi:hypothetical protein
MLFDPTALITDPLPIIATVLIIVVGKSILALGIVLAFRMPMTTAVTVAVSLAQVGEFSFILAALGVELGLLPEAGQQLILGGAIIIDSAQSFPVLGGGQAAAEAGAAQGRRGSAHGWRRGAEAAVQSDTPPSRSRRPRRRSAATPSSSATAGWAASLPSASCARARGSS